MSKKKLSKMQRKVRELPKLANQEWPKCMDCSYEFPLLKALGIVPGELMRCAECEKKYDEKLARRERIGKLVLDAIDKGDRLRLQAWGRGCWFNSTPKAK